MAELIEIKETISGTENKKEEVTNSWSYSHFMYLIYKDFQHIIDNINYVLEASPSEIENLLYKINAKLESLERQIQTENIILRPNKIYIHDVDVEYNFPDNYNFIEKCKTFISSSGIIVFNYLGNFPVISRYLEIYGNTLSYVKHPITADTIWHLNPFIMDMYCLKSFDKVIYNFRRETVEDRRFMAITFDFPPVYIFPLDEHNTWNMDSEIYLEDYATEEVKKTFNSPLSRAKYITKYKRPTASKK